MAATKCSNVPTAFQELFFLAQTERKTTQYIDGATITERKQTNNAYRAPHTLTLNVWKKNVLKWNGIYEEDKKTDRQSVTDTESK